MRLFLTRVRVKCITVVNQGGRAQQAGECDGGGIYDKQINVGVWLKQGGGGRRKKGLFSAARPPHVRLTEATDAGCREGTDSTKYEQGSAAS